MIIDCKGKLFGKVSIIDIIIILAVILGAFAVYVRFVARPANTQVITSSFTYQVKIKGLRDVSVDAIQQSKDTKFFLAEKGRSDDLGMLTDVEVMPSKEVILKNDGTSSLAEQPSRNDIILTLKLDGMINDKGYFTPQLKDIGVGGMLLIRNKYIKTEGQVISITQD